MGKIKMGSPHGSGRESLAHARFGRNSLLLEWIRLRPMVSTKVSKLLTALVLMFFSASATTYSVVIPVKVKGSGPLFRVQRQGKWGYMTRSGRVVIKPQFTYAEDFLDGLAAV